MQSLLRPLILIAFATILLAGCGRFTNQQREPWRREAELACMRSKAINPGDYIKKSPPIGNSWSCGADFPLKVSAFANETTASIPGQNGGLMTDITPAATLVCPMVTAMDRWIAEAVQPAAMARFGQPVTLIKTMGSYNCRPRNNQSGAKLSEHGFANAVDIAGFVLADGQTITVVKDWKHGTPQAQAFLRQVQIGACSVFTTVLAPGSNAFHYNHIHLDLARHGAKGNRHYCRPIIDPASLTPVPSLFDAVPRPGPEALTSQFSPTPLQQRTVAGSYIGRPGESPAAPVYNRATPVGGPYAKLSGGESYNPDYRPARPVGQPLAVGVRPQPQAGVPDESFEGNDDENIDVHQFDLPDDGSEVTGQIRR